MNAPIAEIRLSLARKFCAATEQDRVALAHDAVLTFGGIFIPQSKPTDSFQQPAQISLLGVSGEDFSMLGALSMWIKAACRSAQD